MPYAVDAMARLAKILGSKEYIEASRKIRKWKERLEKGEDNALAPLLAEKNEFFSEMRKKRPDLFKVFMADQRHLRPTRPDSEQSRLSKLLLETRDSLERLRTALGESRMELALMQLRSAAVAEAARGHEAPSLILRDVQEAREHSRQKMEEARSRIPASASANPAAAEPYRPFDGKMQQANEELNREIMSDWLSPSYLDDPIVSMRFGRTRPILTTENPPFFKVHESFYGYAVFGFFFPDTNHIVASSQYQKEGDRRVLIAHEQLHYASWLGGGFTMFTRCGSPEVFGYVSWLHEGLTELHAEDLTRGRGFQPSFVAYPYETVLCAYLRHLMSDETIKRAYLTGDFTQAHYLLDQLLGPGAFSEMVRRDRGAEALAFLTGKLDAAGIKHSSFRKNEIIKAAGILK